MEYKEFLKIYNYKSYQFNLFQTNEIAIKACNDWCKKYNLTIEDLRTRYLHWFRNIKEIPKCPICKTELSMNKGNKYSKYCSANCSSKDPNVKKKIQESVEKSNLEKYGVKNVFQSDIIKNKIKETFLKKYGVEYATQSEVVRNKVKETSLKRYGVEYVSQLESVKNKVKHTHLEKYGGIGMASKSLKEKTEQTNLEKYGVKNAGISKVALEKIKNYIVNKIEDKDPNVVYDFDNKTVKWKDLDTGEVFEYSYLFYYRRKRNGIDLNLNRFKYGAGSRYEDEIKEFLEELGFRENVDFIKNDRQSIKPLELDFYFKDLHFAIEFNGLYWHSTEYKDKNYHRDKFIKCNENNINLFQIYEDDWIYKKDIIKSMLRYKLNKIDNKIYARKCQIRKVNKKDIEKFLDENHLQGYSNSKLNYGLYYNNELVSLMTFGISRFNHNEYELIRFCNKLNTNVIGAASKLLNHFIK